jgi:NADPH:quinone reductase-like Zn-dependent oxidoreductase
MMGSHCICHCLPAESYLDHIPFLLSILISNNYMPAVAPNTGALVLVSGANGYIALHVIRVLLEKGYCVRGTVRTQEKVAHLKETFASYRDKIEVVVVPDITVVC